MSSCRAAHGIDWRLRSSSSLKPRCANGGAFFRHILSLDSDLHQEGFGPPTCRLAARWPNDAANRQPSEFSMVWGLVGFLLFFGILLAWGVGREISTPKSARPKPQEKLAGDKEPPKE